MLLLLANIVWPALYLSNRMLAVWPIVAGLIVEFFFVRYATKLRGFQCLSANLIMNLVSTIAGIVLIPFSGLVWEWIASLTVHPALNVGTFNPVSWGVTLFLAASINAMVEGTVLRYGFTQVLSDRGSLLLLVANCLSVSVAFTRLPAHR